MEVKIEKVLQKVQAAGQVALWLQPYDPADPVASEILVMEKEMEILTIHIGKITTQALRVLEHSHVNYSK